MSIESDSFLEVIEEEGAFVINQKWCGVSDEFDHSSCAEKTPTHQRRRFEENENGNKSTPVSRKISHLTEETDEDDDTLHLRAMPEFQDRLEYLDERYEHLKKHIKTLKQKMQSLESILIAGEESETADLVREIISDLKKEKKILRDEAAIIRGEFNQATYKEEGRLCMSGDKRRAEAEVAERERWLAEREERIAREAAEREKKRQERLKELEVLEEEERRRAEIDRQRAAAMDRLKNIHFYEQAEAAAAAEREEKERQEREAAQQAIAAELQRVAPATSSGRSPKRNALCSIRSFFCRSPKKAQNGAHLNGGAKPAPNGDSARSPTNGHANGAKVAANGHTIGGVNGQTVIANGHPVMANGNGVHI